MIRILVVLALMTLTACTAVGPKPSPSYDPLMNQALLLSQSDWSARGRVLVRQPSDSWKATLSWEHKGGDDRLVISTALGGVLSVFESTGDHVKITDDQGRSRVGEKQALLAELGLDVPLDSMVYWVRGLADPRMPANVVEVEGRLVKAFQQENWTIQYDRFGQIDGVWLPHKVSLQSDALLVRFVVDDWEK